MNGDKRIRLPDGRVILVPSDATEEYKKRLREEILRTFPSLGPGFSLDAPEDSPEAPPDTPPQERSRSRRTSRRSLSPESISAFQEMWKKEEEGRPSGIRSVSTTGYTGEEGTTLGSIGEMVKNLPRGAHLSGLMMLQGIAALPTPHKDTAWEKSLRRKIREIYEKIDPVYAEAHLPQLGMALGQFGGILGGAAAVGYAGAAAGLSTAAIKVLGLGSAATMGSTMTAGEQAGMIADYEERTGEDVSSSKEFLALSLSAGLGLTEAWPMARLGKRISPLLPDIARRAIERGVSKKAMQEGAEALTGSTLRRAYSATKGQLASSLAQAMKEGAQEGAQQYGQSKIAYWLYDDEAMVGAGVEALREAVIGGEVGAIADVLTTMATRVFSPGRFHNVAGIRVINALKQQIGEGIDSGKIDDPIIREFATSQDPAIAQRREEFLRGTAVAGATRESDASVKKIQQDFKDGKITEEQKDERLKNEQDALERAVNNWIVGKEGIFAYQREEAIKRGEEVAPTDVISQVEFTDRIMDISTRAKQDPSSITAEDAAFIANPNISVGLAKVPSFLPSDVWSQIRNVLRGKPSQFPVESDKEKLNESRESPLDLSGRLITAKQRKSLEELGARFETNENGEVIAGNDALSVPEVQRIISEIFDGGVYNLTKRSIQWRDTDAGPRLEIDNKTKKSGSAIQRKNGRQAKHDVLDDIFGWSALVDIGLAIDNERGNKATDPGFEALAHYINDFEMSKVIRKLITPVDPQAKDGKVPLDNIPQPLAEEALKSRHIDPDLVTFVAKTLGMDRKDAQWKGLTHREKQLVMARIIRTQIQAVEGAKHGDVSPVPAEAGQAIMSVLATPTRKSPKKKTIYKQFVIGTKHESDPTKHRSKAVQNLTSTINKNLGLNLSVDDVIDFVERLADYGLVKYLAPTKRGEYTRVQFLDPSDAVKEMPLISRRQSAINLIKEGLVRDGIPRSPRQLVHDAEDIANAGVRLNHAKEYLIEKFTKRGVRKEGIKIAIALDSVYADIKDIFNDPNIIVDSKANADGPTAAIENYGTMMIFNLSQMENRYPDLNDIKVEEILKSPAFHEGVHLYYINGVLTPVEQGQLSRYGNAQLVPVELLPEEMQAEIEAGTRDRLTWRQWVESIYEGQNKSDIFLDEETGVRILEALHQGNIPKQKSVGFMNKIKNDLKWKAETIIHAMKSSDLVSVMRIAEQLQSGELRSREQKRLEAGTADVADRVLMYATEEQYYKLMKLGKKGTDQQLAEAAREVAFAREEVSSVEFDVNKALINTFRARKMVESTPKGMEPILNIDAIDRGEVLPETLDGFFEIEDGDKAPLRSVSQVRELRKPKPRVGYTVEEEGDEGLIELAKNQEADPESKIPAGADIIISAEGHTITDKGDFIGTFEEMKKLLQHSTGEMLRHNLVDDKMTLSKQSEEVIKQEMRLYGEALSNLAEVSAITGWRFADIASKLVDGMLHDGVPQYENGGFNLKQSDAEYTQQGLVDLFSSFMDESLGENQERRTAGYMRGKRILEIYDFREDAKIQIADLQKRLKIEKDPAKLDVLRDQLLTQEFRFELNEELYNALNPRKEGVRTRFPDIEKARDLINDIESGGTRQREAVLKFHNDYRTINKWMIDFAWKTGQITDAQKDFFSEYQHLPFYTKTRENRGFQKAGILKNSNNKNVEEQARKKFKGILNQAVEGTFESLSDDLPGDIISNFHTIVRDGMVTVAGTKSMRDATFLGTGMKIRTVPKEWENERDSLKKLVKKYEEDPAMKKLTEERLANVEERISERKKQEDADEKRADELGYIPDIYVELRSSHSQIEGTRETDPAKLSVVQEHGVLNKYRVRDLLLQQAIMNVQFDPMTLIEAGFTKVVGITGLDAPTSARVGRKLAKISVGSSRLLREMIVRTPWFIMKNIPRDAFTASAAFGGGPELFLKALTKMFDPNTLKEARRYGLTIPPYEYIGSRTEREQQSTLQKARKEELRSWMNPIDILPKLWATWGTLSQKSEVATRLAIREMLIEQKYSEVEATKQAIEIINYGRRGADPRFGVYAALSPFINGRIQGMDALARILLGKWDAPGVVGQIDNPTAEREVAYRRGVAFGRSQWIMAMTLLYYLYWFDEEEYKNTPEAIKNDYWLIPTPEGVPPLRWPIPFELGVLFKVIPEQLFRSISESEHDIRDVREETVRQIRSSIDLIAAPQIVRPILGAIQNKDSYLGRDIVAEWMDDRVLAPYQKTPRTNEVASSVAEFLDKIPLIKSLPFSDQWTSPMKLAYLVQGYTGTIGIYGMAVADKIARGVTEKNRVGTAADFPWAGLALWPFGSDSRTWENIPVWGDFFLNTERGGGYQEDLYDLISNVNTIVTTLNRPDMRAAETKKFKKKYDFILKQRDRLRRLENRLKTYRSEVEELMLRDIPEQEKRDIYYRKMKGRDRSIKEVERIKAEIREDRGFLESLLGRNIPG